MKRAWDWLSTTPEGAVAVAVAAIVLSLISMGVNLYTAGLNAGLAACQ